MSPHRNVGLGFIIPLKYGKFTAKNPCGYTDVIYSVESRQTVATHAASECVGQRADEWKSVVDLVALNSLFVSDARTAGRPTDACDLSTTAG